MISILFPGWTRAVMWRAARSPSLPVAMDEPPISKGYYLRMGPLLLTPDDHENGVILGYLV